MKKSVLAVLVIGILIVSCAFAQGFGIRVGGTRDYVPEPRLLSPVTETVDLTGKDILKFRWSPHEGSRFDRKYYDLRIYKGFDMVQSTLIYKQKVYAGTYEMDVPSDLFESGSVYTWSLRQIYRGGNKSWRSFYSFRVIK
jgi:hypothetical protein